MNNKYTKTLHIATDQMSKNTDHYKQNAMCGVIHTKQWGEFSMSGGCNVQGLCLEFHRVRT